MKKRFRATLFLFSLTLFLLVSFGKSMMVSWWQEAGLSVYPTIEEAIQHAKASNNVSQKYKIPNGSWTLPFELYQQVLVRSENRDDYVPRPILVDLNRDDLLDVVFSRYSPATSTQFGGGYVSSGAGLNQYILLAVSGGGYSSVFSCSLIQSGTHDLFQGDCADTSFPFDPNYRLTLPDSQQKPPVFFPYDNTQWIRRAGNSYAGTDAAFVDCPNNWSGHRRGDCDRPMAKLMDINGDGLMDITFHTSYQQYVNNTYPPWATRTLSYSLFNTGSGFSP